MLQLIRIAVSKIHVLVIILLPYPISNTLHLTSTVRIVYWNQLNTFCFSVYTIRLLNDCRSRWMNVNLWECISNGHTGDTTFLSSSCLVHRIRNSDVGDLFWYNNAINIIEVYAKSQNYGNCNQTATNWNIEWHIYFQKLQYSDECHVLPVFGSYNRFAANWSEANYLATNILFKLMLVHELQYSFIRCIICLKVILLISQVKQHTAHMTMLWNCIYDFIASQ